MHLPPRPAATFTDRRAFLKGSLVAGSASLGLSAAPPARDPARRTFHLRYAPHLGMFRHSAGDDPLDQLKFMADRGFTAFEDNGMRGRAKGLQEKIGAELARLGMQMGVFVAHGDAFGKPSFSKGDPGMRDAFLADMKNAVEVAKRVGATWCTVVPGEVYPRLEPDYQAANVVETLRRGAEICEPSGLVMVLEPLNWWADHPNMFLTKVPQAYMICKAVDSPSCKILFDIYHQQITEGNLIPNIDRAWEEIAYFQMGDNPGRKEPGTGEINYRNVFRHIHGKGFKGVLGMEHGNSQPGVEGEQAVIQAYHDADDF